MQDWGGLGGVAVRVCAGALGGTSGGSMESCPPGTFYQLEASDVEGSALGRIGLGCRAMGWAGWCLVLVRFVPSGPCRMRPGRLI